MRKLLFGAGAGIGLASFSAAVLASREEVLTTLGKIPIYIFLAFVIVVGTLVFFMRMRDKRRAPVQRIFERGEAIYAVGPDASVAECVRTMTAKKIGALLVKDGERLVGIFTERDALNKVLAPGLDARNTKISEVMTRDPYSIEPTTTVAEAMEVITTRRIRHLPIVEGGKVLAVISSGDLTHWLVKDQLKEVQELVDLAAR